MNHPPPLAVNRYDNRKEYFFWNGKEYIRITEKQYLELGGKVK